MSSKHRERVQILLLVLCAFAFLASFFAPFFHAGPRASREPSKGDYTFSEKAICGLATSPNTACATDLIHKVFFRSQPIQCGTPQAMAQVLKDRKSLSLLSDDSVASYCENWQSAQAQYKLESYQVYSFGWLNFVMGEFWAWGALPFAILAVFFLQRKPQVAFVFASAAVLVGSTASFTTQWSFFDLAFARNPQPILGAGVGYYAFQAALIFLWGAVFTRGRNRSQNK